MTNREAELALKWNAAVVREDADFGTVAVDAEGYRGRTFNRVMDNAARGLLERIASAKLAWLGIPEVRLPAPYTSSSDWRCALVDKAQRTGEVFRALIDGMLALGTTGEGLLFGVEERKRTPRHSLRAGTRTDSVSPRLSSAARASHQNDLPSRHAGATKNVPGKPREVSSSTPADRAPRYPSSKVIATRGGPVWCVRSRVASASDTTSHMAAM